MISIEQLTKHYGDFTAVDNLSITIEEGHVYGFLGPNGAGKSTTMNIMTGCLSATTGQVLIDGKDIFEEADKAKKLIGYLPEQPPLYMNETPIEYLTFVGEAKGIRGKELKQQITRVIEQTKLEGVKDCRIATLSKGYKQRVGIAQALLGNPAIIILDEPTVGLDPIQIIEIRDLIKELGKSHTVIFSSHILSEVQEICDKVIMIANGKLVLSDDTKNISNGSYSNNEILITTDATEDELESLIGEIPEIKEINQNGSVLEHHTIGLQLADGNVYDISAQIFNAFAKSNHVLYEMVLKKASLEDIFIQLAEKEEAKEE